MNDNMKRNINLAITYMGCLYFLTVLLGGIIYFVFILHEKYMLYVFLAIVLLTVIPAAILGLIQKKYGLIDATKRIEKQKEEERKVKTAAR